MLSQFLNRLLFSSVLTIRTTAQRCKPGNQENCKPGQQQHHANFLQISEPACAVKLGCLPLQFSLSALAATSHTPCSSNAHWQPGRDRHEERRGGTKERGEEGVTWLVSPFAIRPVLSVIASPQREQLSLSTLALYVCSIKGTIIDCYSHSHTEINI